MNPETLPRGFKGIWIPKEIWCDKRLSYFDKCLFAEIDSLEDEVKGCTASNEHLCKIFDESDRKISQGLSKLKNLNLIYVESFDGRVRILRTNKKTIYTEFYGSAPQKPTVNTIFYGADPHKTCNASLGAHTLHERKEERKESVCVAPPPVEALPQENHFKVEKKSPDGSTFTISKNDIFTTAIKKRKDWSEEEIDMLWETIYKYQEPIRDWVLFAEGVISNNRKMAGLKKIKDKSCKITQEKKSTSSNQQQKTFNEKTMESATLGRPLANWRSLIGWPEESQAI